VLTRLQREDGQAMAEYGLILALIAAVVVVALAALTTGIGGMVDTLVSKLA
jgi:Flp pilus assembly pilin Flp